MPLTFFKVINNKLSLLDNESNVNVIGSYLYFQFR